MINFNAFVFTQQYIMRTFILIYERPALGTDTLTALVEASIHAYYN